MDKKIDLETIDSQHAGIKGFFERFMRRFKLVMHIGMMAPLYLFASLMLGICLVPGIYLYQYVSSVSAGWAEFYRFFALGTSLACGFFLYGFSMMFVTPLFNFILRTKLSA